MANTELDDELPIYDLAEEERGQEEDLQNRIIHLDEEESEPRNKPGLLETFGDLAVQAGRGALKLYTWPLDVLKLGVIGSGLSDLDELEEEFKKAGKPFDRQEYIKSLMEQSDFIPTQDLLEKGIESVTGNSLKPKSELGKIAKQGVELAGFTRGGIGKKLLSAGTGVGTTQALKSMNVGEGKAELIGDLASVGPLTIEKAIKTVPLSAKKLEKTAEKFALPFKEFMTREREPIIKGRLLRNTEARLKNQFRMSTQEVLNKIVDNEIPIKRLRDRGVNLDTLGSHAYDTTEKLARAKPKSIDTSEMVKNIDNEIRRIEKLAPSPSDAQKSAIKLLEQERDIMKVSSPSSEQLINQHKNYNADMKSIYRKPEFSGKEEQVRKTYEFLKQELVNSMEKQGSEDVANAFKAANKIYHETSKLNQTESLLNKAFNGETYSPKKLEKLLASKQGNFLRRNMSKSAIKDIEEIAQYGREAQEKMAKFVDLRSPVVANEIKSWGQLGPLIFMPHSLQGKFLAIARPLSKHVQGKLLTRDALRETYKLTMKNAAEGSFNLLKKDFMNLEKEISKEWGSVDDFMDDMMDELEIYQPDEG